MARGVERKNRYDVLLCDADDTVLDFQAAMRASIISAAREVGITTDAETVISEFKAVSGIVWRKLEDKEISRGELETMRFFMLGKRLNESFDVAAITEVFRRELKKTRFLIDGATEFLSEVRRRGIKVYIITNGFAPIAHERLKVLDGHVDGVFISDEIGYHKPDPLFFEHVLKAIGGDKSRMLVFGDGINSDIAGGIKSGIDTCLFDPTGTKTCDSDYSVRSYAQALEIL